MGHFLPEREREKKNYQIKKDFCFSAADAALKQTPPVLAYFKLNQRPLTGWLVFCMTTLDSVALLQPKINRFSHLVLSNSVKFETSGTVIFPFRK